MMKTKSTINYRLLRTDIARIYWYGFATLLLTGMFAEGSWAPSILWLLFAGDIAVSILAYFVGNWYRESEKE